MKIITTAAMAATVLALGACNQSPANEKADLAEQKLESQEDIIEKQADVAAANGMEAQSEALDAKADAKGEAADNVDGTNLVNDSAAQ